MTTQRRELVIHGLPLLRELEATSNAQFAELGRHWRLSSGSRSDTGSGRRAARTSSLELVYRSLDRRLFGRGRRRFGAPDAEVPPSGAELPSLERWHLAWCREAAGRVEHGCLCVEFEGLPMSQLEQAVRLRLGQPGGTVCARVWRLQRAQAPTLIMVGRLCMDHRSLHRSVAMCAAKVPGLLQGAIARWGRSASLEDVCATLAPAPMPPVTQLLRLVRSALTRLLWRDQWQIEVTRLGGTQSPGGEIVSVLRPPDSAFWADPFLLQRGQRTWVLFEELAFATKRGHIAAIELDASGRPISPPRVVLTEQWHLSYPFIWREGEHLYMIPEAGESGELTLYEAVGHDLEFRRRAVLISGQRLADATVARVGDRLWMFATCAETGVASMEDALHIYWADRIEGPWHPHALNPVKIDATCSRPAGSVDFVDGVLHRVVMDCSSTYGGRVNWMRVVRLTEDEFEEVPVPGRMPSRDRQEQPWHTFNSIDRMIVTDRRVRLPRWRAR